MGVQPDPFSIVNMNCHKGIDGSVAITEIPEDYCELMENCDISTKKMVKRRAGYNQYGSDLPVRVLPATPYAAAVSTIDGDWSSGVFDGTRIILVSRSGLYRCIYSVDGVNWVQSAIPAGSYRDIAYSPSLNRLVAVGNNVVSYGTFDGWNSATPAEPNILWNSVCWSPALNLFVAVADTFHTENVMTSPDGITWTLRTDSSVKGGASVCWSPELAIFVAVGEQTVSWSSDGNYWNTPAFPAGTWRSVAWSSDLKMFVAVSYQSVNAIIVSHDGIRWDAVQAPNHTLPEFVKVAYDPGKKQFIITLSSYMTVGGLTSTDGYSWTKLNQQSVISAIVPVPQLNCTMFAGTNLVIKYDVETHVLEYTPEIYPSLKFWGYNPTNVAAKLDPELGYQETRDLRDYYVLVEWTDPQPSFKLTDDTLLRLYRAQTTKVDYFIYPYPIVKVLSDKYFVISYDLYYALYSRLPSMTPFETLKNVSTPSTISAAQRYLQFCTGPSFPYIDESSIQGYTPATKTLVLNSSVSTEQFLSTFQVGMPIFYSASMTKTTIASVNPDTRTIVFTAAPALAYPKNYFRFYYMPSQSCYAFGEDLGVTSYSPATLTWFDNPRLFSVSTSSIYAPKMFLYGTGANTKDIQSLSLTQSPAEEDHKLIAVSNGYVFREHEYTTKYVIARPPAVTIGGTYLPNPSTGYFTILGMNAGAYKVGDIIHFGTRRTDGGRTDSTMQVISTTPFVVSHDGPSITLYAGTVLDYTRTSQSIVAVSWGFPGMSFTVGVDSTDVESFVIGSIVGSSVRTNKPCTYSSGDTLYPQPFWGVQLPSRNNKSTRPYCGIDNSETLDSQSLISSVPFSYTNILTSPSRGIWRQVNDTLFSEVLPKPELISIRSIPGTKGFLPITRIGKDVRTGQNVSLILTYAYTDATGRTYESRATEIGEIEFQPDAASDGSDYAENIEIAVKAPPSAEGSLFPLQLRIYRRAVNQATNTEVDYRLEKSIESEQSGGVIVARIGDVLITNPEERLKLYSLDEGNNTPAPRCKYLMSVSNRIVGMNLSTLPYFTVEPLTVFSTETASRYYFKAFGLLSAYLPELDNAETGRKVTLTTSFPHKMVTIPFGLDSATGAIVSSEAQVVGWPGTGFSAGFLVAGIPHQPSGISAAWRRPASTLSYSDTSHQFDIKVPINLTATKLKLRGASLNFPIDVSIDFNGDVFTVVSGSGTKTLKLASSTKWTDTDLTETGVPRILAGHVMIPFGLAPNCEFPAGKSCFITIIPEGTNSRVFLNLSQAVSGFASSLTDDYLLLHGPGTLGGFRENNDTRVLTWESDLFFQAASSFGSTIYDNTTYATLEIYPRSLTSSGSSGVSASTSSIQPRNVVDFTKAGQYSVSIFNSTNLLQYVEEALGFTNPKTVMRIYGTAIGSGVTVGQHITLNIPAADRKKIPIDYPDVSGNMEVVSIADGAASIEVRCLNSYRANVFSANVALDSSTITIVDSMITVRRYPEQGFIRVSIPFTIDVASVVLGSTCFLCLRGADFNSVSLKYTGWWWVAAKSVVSTGITMVTFQAPYAEFGSDEDDAMDRVSAVNMSYAIFMKEVGYIPIPVPVRAGLAENLYDLALPYFTSNSLLTDSPLVQISKRFSVAFRSMFLYYYGTMTDCSKAFTASYGNTNGMLIDVPPNGFFVASMTSDVNRKMSNAKQNASIVDLDVEYNDGTNYTFIKPMFSFKGQEDCYRITAAHLESGKYSVYSKKPAPTYATNVFTYRVDEYPNSIIWTSPERSAIVSNYIPTFKEGAYFDIGSQDDSGLTGGTAFQNIGLIFKKNSIWKVNFGNGLLDFTMQRIQSTVGSYSHNNLPVTDSYCYFINQTGAYFTDGTSVEPVYKLSRSFENYVNNDISIMSRTAGYNDPLAKNVFLGVNYKSQYSSSITDGDSQFNYSYNDGVQGWQVNTRIDALKWQERRGSHYFASTRGKIFKIRTENGVSKYRDFGTAIPIAIRTRWSPGSPGGNDNAVKFKFWKNALVQLGNTSDYTMALYYRKDYQAEENALVSYTIEGGKTGPDGAAEFGTERYVKTLRDTLGQRRSQLSFTLRDDSLDSPSEIYFIGVEGLMLSTKLVPQKNTRSSDR